MTRTRRGLRALLLTSLLLLVPAGLEPPLTQAAIPVIDAPNLVQNLRTAVAQIRAIEQRLEMLKNQVDQYRWMLDQTRRLEDPRFREITRLLARIERVLSDTEGLVYTLPDTSERFLETYPGFEPAEDLRADELHRAETTLETLRAALAATQKMGESFLPSQGELAELKTQALSARGHLEVFEAQAMLSSYMAEEVSKLLEQQAVETNAEVLYYAHRLSTEVTAAESLRQALLEAHRGVGPYEATEPIPVIPPSLPQGLFAPGGRP
jgi:P-type conjugative transfer protein TrbJ